MLIRARVGVTAAIGAGSSHVTFILVVVGHLLLGFIVTVTPIATTKISIAILIVVISCTKQCVLLATSPTFLMILSIHHFLMVLATVGATRVVRLVGARRVVIALRVWTFSSGQVLVSLIVVSLG